MGLKKFFKIKPPEDATSEQNKDALMELGISVKNPNKKRKDKFSAYGKFANDKAEDKVYAPPGYEQYAKPQDELEDLNASPLDANGNEANAKPGQTSSSTREQRGFAESNSMQKDPYAIENEDYRYDDDPYARFQANKSNGRSSANPSAYGGFGGGYNNASMNSFNNGGSYNNQSAENSWSSGNVSNNQNQTNDNSNPRYAQQKQSPVSMSRKPPMADQRGLSSNPLQEKRNPYADTNSYSGAYDINSNKTVGSRNGTSSNSNPYASMTNDLYSNTNPNRSANPYSRRNTSQPQSQPAPVTYTPSFVAANEAEAKTEVDLNDAPRGGEFDFEDVYADKSAENRAALDEPDLNAVITNDDSVDLNASEVDHRSRHQQQQQQWFMDEQQQEQQDFNATTGQYGDQRGYKTFEDIQKEEEARQQQEEDEAVDEIKQEIKFTKQSSVASTRNTLKMAQDAERAGMNTLGMLGHQSEQLNSVEGNLDLMKVQNKVADEKVAELKKLNRSILAVHVSNPFNSKRRRREREEQLKNRKIEEKLMREQTNQQISRSTQRIEGAMNANGNTSEVRERYQRQNILEKAKRYQFEDDEEDDEMELEIDRNLDQIQQVSNRLKKMALTTGQEIDSQQKRLNNIEESTDDLDINLHMNTNRLAGIR